MTRQCRVIRADGVRCAKQPGHRGLCRPGKCRHGETVNQVSAAGAVMAVVCEVCCAVLCANCRRPVFHPPELSWPDVARGGYCVCRPTEATSADVRAAEQLSITGTEMLDQFNQDGSVQPLLPVFGRPAE
jgi:hypothetical protein